MDLSVIGMEIEGRHADSDRWNVSPPSLKLEPDLTAVGKVGQCVCERETGGHLRHTNAGLEKKPVSIANHQKAWGLVEFLASPVSEGVFK